MNMNMQYCMQENIGNFVQINTLGFLQKVEGVVAHQDVIKKIGMASINQNNTIILLTAFLSHFFFYFFFTFYRNN